MNFRKYIGNKAFYKMALGIAIPIMIQNGITNFVNMLDNLMVGRVGTEAMTGVSIVNQFIFIFNLLIFGASSAAGIFMAQYHGHADSDGEKYTFRFKFLICFFAGVIGVVVLKIFDEELIGLFLKSSSNATEDAELTMFHAKEYLSIILIGLIPFAINNVYGSSMRETGDTVTPMTASIIAVATNFVFNYLLIFGSFGFPKLGVAGAAIATVLSRFVEFFILAIHTHRRGEQYKYIKGAFRSPYVPGNLCKQIAIRGFPLMANEFFWALAMTISNQSYSTRGLDVVAAQNIYSTLFNVLNVICISMGTAISIRVGYLLGAGELEEAKDTDRKMIAFSVFLGFVGGIILASVSGLFPMLYNTSESIRSLATYFLLIGAFLLPFEAFANGAYFTLRSGGQVFLTMIFDSIYQWVTLVPLSFCLAHFTDMGIHLMFLLCQISITLKVFIGVYLLKRGTWVRQLVVNDDTEKL